LPLAFGLQTTSDADYCATDHASFSCKGGVYCRRHCRDRRLFLRKTSARPDAGSSARTNRSGNESLVRKKRNGKIGIRANAGGSCSALSSLGKGDHMANHKYLTSPPNLTGMRPGVPYITGNDASEGFP